MSITENTATVGPISFAVGVAVLLIGLIVSPEVIAPIGGAISVLAGFGWVRGGRSAERPMKTEDTRAQAALPDNERYPRSRFLERATLGLGGVVAAGVAFRRRDSQSCRRLSVSGGARSTSGRSARFPRVAS